MRAGLGRRRGDAPVLALERAGGVDHQPGAGRAQHAGEPGIVGIDALPARAKLAGQPLGARRVATGQHQLETGFAGQRPRDARAEVAIAAQQQSLHGPSSLAGAPAGPASGAAASSTSSPYSVWKDEACIPCSCSQRTSTAS